MGNMCCCQDRPGKQAKRAGAISPGSLVRSNLERRQASSRAVSQASAREQPSAGAADPAANAPAPKAASPKRQGSPKQGSPKKGKKKGPPNDGVDRRRDKSDGQWYSLAEFKEFYGDVDGQDRWGKGTLVETFNKSNS